MLGLRLALFFYYFAVNCLSAIVPGIILPLAIRQGDVLVEKLSHGPDYQRHTDAGNDPQQINGSILIRIIVHSIYPKTAYS
jgi:hypothetical protein